MLMGLVNISSPVRRLSLTPPDVEISDFCAVKSTECVYAYARTHACVWYAVRPSPF